jgi:hypothetical protein
LGVKSADDGAGEPCGRVESDEEISVALGQEADGFLMQSIDVDLELKFNAVVEVSFWLNGDPVDSAPSDPDRAVETFDPSGGSDDGPDSADGDNYRYIFGPIEGVLFDEVRFTPTTGSLSLEGGADFTENGSLVTDDNASQFGVVRSFDGEISCGPANSATIDDPDIEEVVGDVTMQALNLGAGWDANCTMRKPFNEDVTLGVTGEGTLLFAPVLADTDARYTMILTLKDQPITTDANGQTTSLIMEYNNGFGGGDRTLQPCLKVPDAADFVQNVDAQNPSLVLPSTAEFACYYGVSLKPTGPGVGTEVWDIFFEDDPGFSFR